MNNAFYFIKKLGLREHPEGGYFAETYRSEIVMKSKGQFAPRSLCSSIYYLLQGFQFSSFHALKSDEIWHFYSGSSLTLHIIDVGGKSKEVILGTRLKKGETFQAVVKSNSWFASSVNECHSFSLVGCTVSPGYDIRDWKLGDRETLTKLYPQHTEIIQKYTRNPLA
jgi:predicted cupin superfamily sugar epimerase